MTKLQQMAEEQIKAKNEEVISLSTSGRQKKIPERFNNGVDDAMLDLITSDEMSTYEAIPEIKQQPTKPKKRKTRTPPPATGIKKLNNSSPISGHPDFWDIR